MALLSSSTSSIVEEKVLKESDLGELQLKEVPFSGGKVLLSKVNGRVSATSHACTHVGAPLVKGALTKSGLVICPWHAAAFCVGSGSKHGGCGDIEDAPGWDNLKTYEVSTADGWIVVKGEAISAEEANQKGWLPTRPARLPKGLTVNKDGETVVVVGGGAAALGAVSTLRDAAFAGRIIVLSSEKLLPINRIRLSKGPIAEKDFTGLPLRKQAWFDEFGVEVRLGTTVESVDFAKSTVTTTSGTVIPYTKILLAPGATPRVLAVPNHTLGGIHPIRSADDAVALTTSLAAAVAAKDGAFDLIVVGTSFIGGEITSYVSKAYPKARIALVGLEDQPLETAFGAEVGRRVFRAAYEAKGVKFIKGSLSAYKADASGAKVAGVTLADGTELPADVVVTAVGVVPATSFLRTSGIALHPRDGSVLADEHFRVKGVSNAYVAGDAARFPDVWLGGSGDLRIEHWDVAINQGRLAGRNIAREVAGQELLKFEAVPFFWTGQLDKSFRFSGHLTSPFPGTATSPIDVVVKGEPEHATAPHFSAWYHEKASGKVLAVLTLNEDPKAVKFAARVRDGDVISIGQVDEL
ncbi:FAD/NAD(P)-binding domain-containing protein [Gonapodya prolifera JEL478]|uniref:FAD/NAD(P)-binding domain-containing protein n=1 Tax=Gonapodya prolifera (strain JEL478) TaxID=1344416 RepID=A0A139ANF9_GONPJ|nr:FAD/NAD(P)-binding domain-containing protein [Gonapodya prolifera JEL478]|eukprot:KXS18280.1 FAD/NAD(P)-binding domain-containing protein [Gonapodya prolifera JEL478]